MFASVPRFARAGAAQQQIAAAAFLTAIALSFIFMYLILAAQSARE